MGRNKLLISTTPSLLRAAAAGDIDHVRNLLAQGADLDGTTEGGQTALMLASISGLSEVVRLLLGAGADVHMKDRLGLTAIDWSKRRGFSEVAELLESAAQRDTASTQTTLDTQDLSSQSAPKASTAPEPALPTPAEQSGTCRQEDGWEKERSRLEHVARIQALFDQLRVADDSHPSSEDKGRKESLPDELRQERLKVEDERIRANRENLRRIEATRRTKQEHGNDELERAANELAREKSRLESERIAAESRRRVEEEVYKRSQRGMQTALKEEPEASKEKDERAEFDLSKIEADFQTEQIAKHPDKQAPFVKAHPRETRIITQDIWRAQPEGAVALAASSNEPGSTAPVKRCPKCKAIFSGEFCTSCASKDRNSIGVALSPSSPPASVLARPTVWALMTITLAGGVFIGYQLNDYLSTRDDRASATIAASTEPPVIPKPEVIPTATPNLPLVGGLLRGAEENVPQPEYPATAKSEGVAGTIIVRVRVNNRGRVILASSSSGDERLRAAAVQAAERATFLPHKLASDEGFVSGTITYTFKP